jgi:nucleoside-diphosphate-sugar epimerase
MVKKKILITGGSGYIGSRLSLYLSQKGFDIIPLCNSKIPDNREWIQSMHIVLQGDLRDQATLNKIEAIRPDAIIHLVSLDHNQSGINFQETLQVNVQTTWELLEISRKIELKKFLYFSTVHVYDINDRALISENTKANPLNVYGLTHLLSENIVNYYNNSFKLNATSFRLSNSYGEPVFSKSNSWNLAVNYICKAAYFDKKIVLKSDGSDLKDFIHYSSICFAIEKALLYDFHFDNIYNLCHGTSISVLDLAFMVKNIYLMRFCEDVDVYINDSEKVDFFPKDVLYQKYFSNEKISSNLDIKFTDLNKGINLIFDYLIKNKSFLNSHEI